jgi:hypothetical protein
MKRNLTALYAALLLAGVMAISCSGTPQTVPPQPVTQQEVKKPELKPPVIKDILGPKEAAPSEDTAITCWAVDPDGRKLTYNWSVDNGTITGQGRSAIWKTPAQPGSYTISVKVVNDAGLEASQSKSFTVVPVPETHKTTDTTVYLKLSFPSNDVVKISAPLRVTAINEIQCVIEGAEASGLTFKWSAPVGKLSGNKLAEGKASRVGWIAPGTPGDYTISVLVTDQSGHEARGEVTFNVYAD